MRFARQGFATVEALAGALLDMILQLAATATEPIDLAKFELETLAVIGMPNKVVMRQRTTQFARVSSSDDYSAGYYAYLRSDTLAADACEAFQEAGGPWDIAVAKRLYERVFSVGNTLDPAEGNRALRGAIRERLR